MAKSEREERLEEEMSTSHAYGYLELIDSIDARNEPYRFPIDKSIMLIGSSEKAFIQIRGLAEEQLKIYVRQLDSKRLVVSKDKIVKGTYEVWAKVCHSKSMLCI